MLAPRALFLLIAWTMNLGCLAAPVSLPDSASKDEWTQPSQPSGRRVEASNDHAREVIHKWTDEEIASAVPRNMKVHDEPTRRSRKLLQTEVIDDEWDSNWGGVLQNAAGRLYYKMKNANGGYSSYVCSGTVVIDDKADRSVIMTAAHCVFNDEYKEFAKDVIFIPNQAGGTGSRTDSNCNNDPLGCWAASFGVADTDWASRSFPANIPWDYAMYVVEAVGAREGPSTRADGTAIQDSLELAVLVPGSNIPEVSFEAAVSDPMPFTYALGYSYKDDPNFHHCGKELSLRNGGLFLDNCLLSGGASGGPWIQGNAQDHKLISVNSWGYSDGVTPGMGAPRLDNIMGGHASDVFALAKCAAFSSAGSANGVIWCEDGADSTADEGTCTDNVGAVGGICNPGPTPSPTSAPTLNLDGCVEKTLPVRNDGVDGILWNDSDGANYNCAWYARTLSNCAAYGNSFANEGLTANMACCACGGGDYPPTQPIAQPTAQPIAQPIASPTPPPTPPPTKTPTASPSEEPTPSPSEEPTPSPSEEPTPSPSEEPTPSPTISNEPTAQPTGEPTESAPPQECVDKTLLNGSPWHDIDGARYSCAWYVNGFGSRCNTYGDSYAKDDLTANQACCGCGGGETPGDPNAQPTPPPTAQPTDSPTNAPSDAPTNAPSDSPTNAPSDSPTKSPTNAPSDSPTKSPSDDSAPPQECVDKTLQNGDPWNDSDGASFNCAFYESGSGCTAYGDSYANEGLTANQACCVCGGGETPGDPNAQPTPSPSEEPTGEPTASAPPQECVDKTLQNGDPWHDIDGPRYSCAWYQNNGFGSRCNSYGNSYANEGLTANQACCGCGGGTSVEPAAVVVVATTAPTDQPTQAPTATPETRRRRSSFRRRRRSATTRRRRYQV